MIDAAIKREINLIIVEYKDRLTRFGLESICHFLEGLGCKVEIMNLKTSEDENKELIDDILALITSFSARLYGKRGGRRSLKGKLGL